MMRFFDIKKYAHNNLYNVVSEYYKTRLFPDVIYDRIRCGRYGKTSLSYDGQGECGETSRVIQKYLSNQGVKTQFYYVNKGYEAQRLQLSCFDHAFLCVHGDRKTIIDPTWKQLFFQKSGRVEKWFSPYADFLYSLPPVFIGTDDELSKMLSALHVVRQNDPFHAKDVWVGDWHRLANPQIEPDNPQPSK